MPENEADICIDCSPLLVRSAGVKTYLHHWLKALRAGGWDPVTTFLEPPEACLDHRSGVERHLIRLAALWGLNQFPAGLISRFVPKCSVFHASNLLRRFPRQAKLSATVHDLTAQVVPDFHTRTQREADDWFGANVLQRADGLICVSRNTMRDAERVLRVNTERMAVIYPGVPDAYFRAGPVEVEEAARSLKLRKPYFLFVSTVEPRKNLDGLLSAWLSLPNEFRSGFDLVVAGMPGWKAESTMRRLKQLAGEDSGVKYAGYVAETLMPGLTAGAVALVYPSFYEGFGIPVAQAMAAGCPVIASGVSSLPEILGGAGLLVDPSSQGEIAAAIRRIAESESLRSQLRSLGRERAKVFTWERAARESFRYFRDLAQ